MVGERDPEIESRMSGRIALEENGFIGSLNLLVDSLICMKGHFMKKMWCGVGWEV